MKTNTHEKIDFKAAMQELEEINRWYQNEDIDLDEGLQKLKRAKELIMMTKKRLTEVENEFNSLKSDPDGSMDYVAEEHAVHLQRRETDHNQIF